MFEKRSHDFCCCPLQSATATAPTCYYISPSIDPELLRAMVLISGNLHHDALYPDGGQILGSF